MWATWTMDAPRGGGQPEGCPSGAPATRHFHSPSAAGCGGWTEAVVLRLYGGIPAGLEGMRVASEVFAEADGAAGQA